MFVMWYLLLGIESSPSLSQCSNAASLFCVQHLQYARLSMFWYAYLVIAQLVHFLSLKQCTLKLWVAIYIYTVHPNQMDSCHSNPKLFSNNHQIAVSNMHTTWWKVPGNKNYNNWPCYHRNLHDRTNYQIHEWYMYMYSSW